MQVAGIDTAHYTQTDTICTEGSIHDGTHPQYSVSAGCSDFRVLGSHTSSGRSAQECVEAEKPPLPRNIPHAFGTSRLPADLYGICSNGRYHINSPNPFTVPGLPGAVFLFQFPSEIVQNPFLIRRPQRRHQIPLGAVTGDPVNDHMGRHLPQAGF